MITLGTNQILVCQICDSEVRLDTTKFSSCLCDTDTDTWVGVERTGRIYESNKSNYEIVTLSAT